jgi:hypothetical protein
MDGTQYRKSFPLRFQYVPRVPCSKHAVVGQKEKEEKVIDPVQLTFLPDRSGKSYTLLLQVERNDEHGTVLDSLAHVTNEELRAAREAIDSVLRGRADNALFGKKGNNG